LIVADRSVVLQELKSLFDFFSVRVFVAEYVQLSPINFKINFGLTHNPAVISKIFEQNFDYVKLV